MEQLEGCYGCRSLARRITEADATIAALQEEIATRDSTDSILATRIRELEARLTQRTEQVAALQARVQELEAIKIPDDAFTYCAYCGEKSPVDEHNEDLAAHIKVCPKHPMRDVESQLTQRTVELEAANKRVMDERNLSNSWMKKHDELLAKVHKSGQFGAVVVQDVLKERDTLQAELERVRGELAETKEEVKRCGTCRWWKIHDGQENRIDCATGDCTYPLPICLPDEYRITPYAKAGKDCPTWHAK